MSDDRPSMVHDHPDVRAARTALETAEGELRTAQQDAERLAHDLETQDDALLRAEAMLALGEGNEADVKRRTREVAELRAESTEASRDVRRKEYALAHLRQKLADAEEHAVQQLRQKHEARLAAAVSDVARHLRATMTAAQKLDDAEQDLRRAGLRAPNGGVHLTPQDLMPEDAPSRSRWHGGTGWTRLGSRGAYWLRQMRDMGYDVGDK